MSERCVTVVLLLSAIVLNGCGTRVEDGQGFRDAVHLLLEGKPRLALVECEAILASTPKHFEALLLRGEIYEALRDFDQARDSYLCALEVRPGAEQALACLEKLEQGVTTNSTVAVRSASKLPPKKEVDLQTGESIEQAMWKLDPPADESALATSEQEQLIEPIDSSLGSWTDNEIEARHNVAAKPAMPVNPMASLQTRLASAVEEGRRLDRLDRERWADATDPANELTNEEESTVVVTRFDLGSSLFPPNQAAESPIPSKTTGHVSSLGASRSFSLRVLPQNLSFSFSSRTGHSATRC